jgi:hypothetical protein
MNTFMDELKWFYKHDVRIHLSPKPNGWNLKFSIPDGEPPNDKVSHDAPPQ